MTPTLRNFWTVYAVGANKMKIEIWQSELTKKWICEIRTTTKNGGEETQGWAL